MIAGIGIDLCQISRMADNLQNPHFLERFFSAEERDYIRSKNMSAAQSAAGIFAAKEAFLKALGTGLSGAPLLDVAVLHTKAGAPYYDPRGEALRALKGRRAYLSITHEGGSAAAVCVLENGNE